MEVSKVVNDIRDSVKKNSPEILTGVGIAGMVTTTVLAVRATPKAMRLIEQKRWEEDADELTPIETIKSTWKCYIPAFVTGSFSVACIVMANKASVRRSAALATTYSLSETALKDYRAKVIETMGDEKDVEVREAIVKDKMERDPVTNNEVIIIDGSGVLCYDAYTGRYFESSKDVITKAENTLNREMRDSMYVSLNDFYYEIGLKPIKDGDDIGWNIDNGYIDIVYSSQLADDGRPCLAIDYLVGPRYDYRRLH